MRVNVGVHGRFSAFHIAEALLHAGQDVRLFTNYPRSVVQRFGFPAAQTTSFVRQGVATRVAERLHLASRESVESLLGRTFGSWLRRKFRDSPADVAYCWSGVAEETFRETTVLRALNRSSFHIVEQRNLLTAETQRVRHSLQLPSSWIVAREQREYDLADMILVPSMAARRSFAGHVDLAKVHVVPLTAGSAQWRLSEQSVAERVRRILDGEKLRVLYTGHLSYRKGAQDMLSVVEQLHPSMSFRFTGSVLPECRSLAERLASHAIIDGHVPEQKLRASYEWADVFMAPSIEDGFAVVLAQALAAAIPVITTENTGGPDLMKMGGQGWIVPIRTPEAIVQRLRWCDENRASHAALVQALWDEPLRRTWQNVAEDLISMWSDRT